MCSLNFPVSVFAEISSNKTFNLRCKGFKKEITNKSKKITNKYIYIYIYIYILLRSIKSKLLESNRVFEIQPYNTGVYLDS